MRTPDRPPRMSRLRGRSIGVGLVGVLAGLMFATSASVFAQDTERQPQNLPELVQDEEARLQETNAAVTQLRAEVDALLSEQSAAMPEVAASDSVALAAGRLAVTGPGVEVSLWDSPLVQDVPEGFSPDDLVVHQQDLEAVINAFWAGGAEAMTVQGHRVTATTSIRCVGNVLLLDGYTYSPPYRIAAIGDSDELESALDDSSAVGIYRQYVDAVALGWSMTVEDEIEAPGDEGNLSTRYARVPGGDPISLEVPSTDPNGPQ
ncbi:DUF881 domain-containing protein [Occultella glacieicola]|uniref:DUF881 domain-containing protein n=1 Tax=Occultella glacieicola TaxID=2518684 RepID=A0ABY2E8A3_9MICO|nr:DUF881 domain-containing protein [Occultella glacieicola]TDE98733.1 DUF881 domain-containing protein [Occultella glacieicola]